MIVTLWNYKGGVGKSTIALVLAKIAAYKGLRTLAVDLDDQHNFAHILSLSVVDTHNSLDALSYPVAGRLPLSNLLMRNIAIGRRWNHALRLQHKDAFFHLFSFVQSLGGAHD